MREPVQVNNIIIVNKNYYGTFLAAIVISNDKIEIFGFDSSIKSEVRACIDKILESPKTRGEKWNQNKKVYDSKKVTSLDFLFSAAISEGLSNEGFATFILEDFQREIYRQILDESLTESDTMELLASLPFCTKKIN